MADKNTDTIHIDDDLEVDMIDDQKPEYQMIALPLGKDLKPEDTYAITASENSRFFVILGEPGSGKTTLITSIYQLFFSGKYIDKYVFSGSETLRAFEDRAFCLRTTSMKSQVEMRRTPVGTSEILHIRIKKLLSGEFLNLLFSDFSGEDLNNVIGNINAAKEDFSIVKAADVLLVLIDGEKISKTKTKLAELHRATQLLRTYLDADLVKENAQVLVAVSKYDLLIDDKGELKDDFANTIKERIINQLPNIATRLEFLFIAAMPMSTDILEAGYGIDKLLDLVIKDPNPIVETSVATTKLKSQFNLWKGRAT